MFALGLTRTCNLLNTAHVYKWRFQVEYGPSWKYKKQALMKVVLPLRPGSNLTVSHIIYIPRNAENMVTQAHGIVKRNHW